MLFLFSIYNCKVNGTSALVLNYSSTLPCLNNSLLINGLSAFPRHLETPQLLLHHLPFLLPLHNSFFIFCLFCCLFFSAVLWLHAQPVVYVSEETPWPQGPWTYTHKAVYVLQHDYTLPLLGLKVPELIPIKLHEVDFTRTKQSQDHFS